MPEKIYWSTTHDTYKINSLIIEDCVYQRAPSEASFS